MKASGVRRVRKQSGGLFSRQTRKHGGPKRRVWRKVHLGIDEETLEIRAVEVTGSDVGDAPMLPELLRQIPADQDIASVTASVTAPSHGFQANRCRATDGAYDTRKCHDAIAERGAAAVIPPRRNAKPSKAATAGAAARNEALRASKYLGRRSGDDGAATTAGAASKRRGIV